MSNLYWDDIASALEVALCSSTIPEGLRPMLIQAIAELRAAKNISASPAVLNYLKTDLDAWGEEVYEIEMGAPR